MLSGLSLHFVTLNVDLSLFDVERNNSIHLRDQIWLVGILRNLSLTAFLVYPRIALIRLIHLLRKFNLSSRVRIVEVLHGQLLMSVAVLSLFKIGLTRVITKRPGIEVVASFGQRRQNSVDHAALVVLVIQRGQLI